MSGGAERLLPRPVPAQATATGAGVIVELVGPAAAGKTTLAHALRDALEARDCGVRLAASARPAERAAAVGRLGAAAARAAKVAGLLPLLLGRHDEGPGARLLAMLPPRRTHWRLRYRRYLADLDRCWAEARRGSEVVIFDQAYRSAAAALAAIGPGSGSPALPAAVAALPRADLVVRLDASCELLAARLAARLGGQGRVERLFELDAAATLRQVAAFAVLDAGTGGRGAPTIRVTSTDPQRLAEAVAEVAAAVVGLRARRQR